MAGEVIPTQKEARISKTKSFVVSESVEKVFPLFGPIEEMKWCDGWAPVVVSGDIEVKKSMVFVTPARFEDETPYQWVITTFAPERYLIEYLVSSTDRVWFINVGCSAMGASTEVTVSYTYIGFNDHACQRNEKALAQMFSRDLQDWQKAVSHYLRTGKTLKA